MPRSIVVGNGNVMVAFAADYALRNIFYPQVGLENPTGGNVCRTGFWVDGASPGRPTRAGSESSAMPRTPWSPRSGCDSGRSASRG